ncbi:hypothetical protein BC567DRAFT_208736 [Phyllosticta citribraziliensis]
MRLGGVCWNSRPGSIAGQTGPGRRGGGGGGRSRGGEAEGEGAGAGEGDMEEREHPQIPAAQRSADSPSLYMSLQLSITNHTLHAPNIIASTTSDSLRFGSFFPPLTARRSPLRPALRPRPPTALLPTDADADARFHSSASTPHPGLPHRRQTTRLKGPSAALCLLPSGFLIHTARATLDRFSTPVTRHGNPFR